MYSMFAMIILTYKRGFVVQCVTILGSAINRLNLQVIIYGELTQIIQNLTKTMKYLLILPMAIFFDFVTLLLMFTYLI